MPTLRSSPWHQSAALPMSPASSEAILWLMADDASARLCRLQDEAGRVENCPGVRCPFWEQAGRAGEEGCIFDRVALDLHGHSELAHHLLRLRRTLECARSDEQSHEASSLFYRLTVR
jgi:hypothetical protein